MKTLFPRIFLSCSFLILLFSISHSEPLVPAGEIPESFKKGLYDFQKSYNWESGALVQIESSGDKTALFSSSEVKSTKKAFLFSLLIPGSGEYYCKSWLKGGLFSAAEIGFWVAYFNLNQKGSDKTGEYETFADDHWSEDKYWTWLMGSGKDTTWWETPESTWATEILPREKDHDYYEMIGKYAWFIVGWDDSPDTLIPDWPIMVSSEREAFKDSLVQIFNLDLSYNRFYYASLRKQANDFYSTAKYFIGASILNHLLSAFDAAWTAKRHNDRLETKFTRVEVKPRIAYHNGELCPEMVLVIRF
ncbi:hypothetical protein JW877_07510 [bacterium]|nr:hypothetical protein [bacterium]